MNQDCIVSIEELKVSFGSNDIHNNINLKIFRGDSLVLLGPSGTGKTVLLKTIVGLIKPTSGKVVVFGQDTSTANEYELSKIRQRVGMLFQGAALFDSLSVYENVAYSLRARGTNSEEEISEIVNEKLNLVGLIQKINSYPSELSGGQRKRVGLARALASEPELILFDEPTTGLDPTSIRRIDNLIVRLNEELGITTLSITHDIDSASRIAKRWVLLSNGEVQADGAPQELVHTAPLVTQFISGEWQGEQ